MFIVSNPKLATTLRIQATGAIASIVDTPTPNNFAPLATIVTQQETASIALTLPVLSDTTTEIYLGDTELRSVESIEIAGVQYTPAADPKNIQLGQFFWNTYTNTVKIAFFTTTTGSALARPPAGAQVKLLAATGIPTDYVPLPYPPIFDLLPLEGTFQWSLSWEGHPSGQFTFRTFAALRESVIRTLTPGTEFNAWGIGFRIGNISITEIPASIQPLRVIQVSVPLGGRHENYVDRVVPLRQVNNGSNLDSIPDCLGDLTEAQRESFGFVARTSVSELAQRAGDRFVGPSMPVTIPSDTPSTEGTTFISKAQEQIRIHGCFLRYSNPNAVEAIALNSVPSWTFQETDLRSQVSSTVAGRKRQSFLGSNFHPQQLGDTLPATALAPPVPTLKAENQSIYPYVHTYEPAYRMEGAFIEYLSLRARTGKPAELASLLPNTESTQANGSILLVPNWKRQQPVRSYVPEGDEHPEIPPPNTGPLKDWSNVFSQSGITKTRKVTVLEDDHPVSDYQERWGFMFLGRDMYQNGNLVGATNKWQRVEEKRTIYHYDKRTGYALGSTTQGWEMVRFKEESEHENTLSNNGQALDPGNADDQKKIKLYEFFKNPYIREERNYLEAHRRYYKETEIPPLNLCKLLLPSGEYRLFGVSDPNFVEPYFSQLHSMYENNFKTTPDPENNPPETLKPPRTTGKESFHRTAVAIQGSRNTRTKGYGESRSEDSFNTYESQFSSQDAGYANSLEQTNFKRDTGRPPVHTRKAPQYVLLEPDNQIGIPIIGKIRKNYFAYTQVSESRVDPSGLLGTQIQGGSLSYPAAKTLEQAQTAAKTEINIQNMRDCLQESFTIPFSPNVREGDRLTYTCNGEVRRRRVLSISHEVEIKGLVNGVPIITSKGSQVNAGLERETPVSFKVEPKPRLDLRGFYAPNTDALGGIVELQVQTRRNF